MKKIVALLLMSVMMLALTGCGGSDKKDEKAAGSDNKDSSNADEKCSN